MPCEMWQGASGRRDTCRTHGKPCVHLHEGGLVYGFGSDMCHTHGMPHACHVEKKWLIDWLDIWTSSSVRGRAAEGRREKKERKERESQKEGRKEKKEEKREEEKRKERMMKRKEEGNRNQRHVGRRTERQRTWNYATKSRFPPTSVISCLGAT